MKVRKKEFEGANAVTLELQGKLDVIESEIETKSSGKIKAVDKNIKEVANNLSKIKSEISRLTVAIKTSER